MIIWFDIAALGAVNVLIGVPPFIFISVFIRAASVISALTFSRWDRRDGDVRESPILIGTIVILPIAAGPRIERTVARNGSKLRRASVLLVTSLHVVA